MLKHISGPVVKDFGYEVVRSDSMPDPGAVTLQIIPVTAVVPLVIADLTRGTPMFITDSPSAI